MKPINLLFIVIFMGLPLLWYVPAMIWGFQITKESMDPEAGISPDLIGGPAPVQWFRDRRDLQAYYSTEELTHRREVSFEMDMAFTDLLAPGEEVPALELQDLYVKARSAAFLIGYCPEVLGPLATKCDVESATGRVGRDGKISIQGSLSYLPAYEIGNVAEVENGDIMLGSVRLFPRDANLPATPENRALAIEKALQLCDLVRAKLGNCLISDLSLRQDQRRRAQAEDPTLLTAIARVAVYADKTLYRPDSLKAEIEQIEQAFIN